MLNPRNFANYQSNKEQRMAGANETWPCIASRPGKNASATRKFYVMRNLLFLLTPDLVPIG